MGDRLRVSYATGLFDSTVQSITDDNHLVASTNAASNQTGARLHFRQAYGNGITIGSVNSKHNQIDRNSFTQCARGLNITNGSFSLNHLGGSANDILVYIGDLAESTDLAYLEDENSLRDVYVNSLDATLTLSHMRNSLGINGEFDGFIYLVSGQVTISSSIIQDTPGANSVVIGVPSPGNVGLTALGNKWGPGVVSMATLGYSQFRTALEASGANGGFLTVRGDYGISDAPGADFDFGEFGQIRCFERSVQRCRCYNLRYSRDVRCSQPVTFGLTCCECSYRL